MIETLQKLGSGGFQDLSAALVMAEFGARVRPLGSGPDGGRDMTYRGSLDWTGRSRTELNESPYLLGPAPAAPLGGSDVWSGYCVFQVKHHAPLAAEPIENARWLWTEMRKELDAWTKPARGRVQTPDHLIFVTNVALSPVPQSGGLAHIDSSLAGYRAALADDSRDVTDGIERRERLRRFDRIKNIAVLDARTLETMITVNQSVRRQFAALLTAGDAFDEIALALNSVTDAEMPSTLVRHATVALAGDRGLSFNEAGAAGGPLQPIDEVAIDLPIHTSHGDRSLIDFVLSRGDRVLRPSTTVHEGPRHLIVAGPMGNGKTTVTKLLVQAYRAAFVHGAANLGAPASAAATGIESRLRVLGRPGLPVHRRWPMRVDLAAFAEDEGQTEKSLVRYIGDLVSARTAKQVQGGNIDAWMTRWPWFLALDGLDEVTEPVTRASVIRRVIDLVADADMRNVDLFVVMTTRPVGYSEEIEPSLFERVDLTPIPLELALSYGRGVLEARMGAEHELLPRLKAQLERAAERENTRELMVTPLQVLILTFIIEAAGPLPPDRFALFWGFYDTMTKREQLKPGAIRRLIEEHLPHITILHERLGFELHRRAQLDHATATMPIAELHDLIAGVLLEDGYDPEGAHASLVHDITQACLQRLVLIRAHGDGSIGFDVRALQELMAGRHITTGRDADVTRLLRRLASDPHWRIPWIFAAGRVFAGTQPHQRDQIVEIVQNVDADASWRLGREIPVGPGLALDLAVDGGARRHPKIRKPLLDHALGLLDLTLPRDPRATARLLVRAASFSDEARSQVSAALRKALGGTPTSRETAAQLMRLIPPAVTELDASPDVRMLATVKSEGPAGRRDRAVPDAWWSETVGRLRNDANRTEGPDLALLGAEALRKLSGQIGPEAQSIRDWERAAVIAGYSIGEELDDVLFDLGVAEPVYQALKDPAASAQLEAALLDMPYQDPLATQRLRDWVLPFAAPRGLEEDWG